MFAPSTTVTRSGIYGLHVIYPVWQRGNIVYILRQQISFLEVLQASVVSDDFGLNNGARAANPPVGAGRLETQHCTTRRRSLLCEVGFY